MAQTPDITRGSERVPFGLKAIGVSAISVAVAAILTLALTKAIVGRAPLTLFVLAIVLAAYYGGMWPGLLATGLSMAIVRLLFEKSVFYSFVVQPNLTAFAVIGLAISFFIHKLRITNAESERARVELAAANEKLLQSSDALIRSNEELERFAYALSHDLKGTLGKIGIFTDLLMKSDAGKLEGDARKHAGLIVAEVQR